MGLAIGEGSACDTMSAMLLLVGTKPALFSCAMDSTSAHSWDLAEPVAFSISCTRSSVCSDDIEVMDWVQRSRELPIGDRSGRGYFMCK